MADSLEQLIQTEITTLKCSLCQNIMSVPPVHLLSEDGTQLRCGRCEKVPKESFGRDFVFEKIANLLSFPCTYDGCDEVIPWGEVKDHEEVCNERTVICPINPLSCKYIKVMNIEKHCLNKHRDNIFYKSFTIKCETIHLPCVLVYEKQLFFIVIAISHSDFKINGVSLNNHTPFKYNLKFANSSNDACVTFEQKDIEKYDERKHCFNCVSNQQCTLIHHPLSKTYGNQASRITYSREIALNSIETLLKTPHSTEVQVTVEINLKSEVVANDTSPNNDMEPTDLISSYQTDHLRNSLQCPICMEYMIGDICNCENGHVVCFTCEAKLDSCPSCRTKFGKSRNLPLENLAEVLMLSCAFADKGCDFSGQVKMLFQHEKECHYNVKRMRL
ncbi:unnamed protein product [Phaedon cochleariae]|uniref:RING-type domain-containing protein n=1 Tax=Phaedon cochleariae TaxID=80249 RepID=A0A9P0GPC3_PHACE|nr:unnamed protein product [Phaedon cochleariae]